MTEKVLLISHKFEVFDPMDQKLLIWIIKAKIIWQLFNPLILKLFLLLSHMQSLFTTFSLEFLIH